MSPATRRWLLIPLLCAACQSPLQSTFRPAPRRPAPRLEAAEAALIGRGDDAADSAAVAPAEPQVIAVDTVTAELIRAAFASYARHRRVVLENIANVHTPAYKKRVVLTRIQAVRGTNDAPVPVPVQLDAAPVFTMGPSAVTERALDVAIDGAGFFAVQLQDGSVGYTRAGGFHVNAEGRLVTAEGRIVVPEITVPQDLLEIAFDPGGLVTGRTAGAPDVATQLGQLTLHRFLNPTGLLPLDATTWRPTESAGVPISGTPGLTGHGQLRQGFLEGSNVVLEQELLDLQLLERQHQVLTKVLAQFGMIAP